jgi:diadenylate cyclase
MHGLTSSTRTEDWTIGLADKSTEFTNAIIKAAGRVAKSASAQVLLVYADAVESVATLQNAVKPPTKLVMITRDEKDVARIKDLDLESFSVPSFSLTRMGQIKMATLLAFSQGILKPGDVFVFLTGVTGQHLDTMVVMEVGQEYELFQTVGQPKLTEHIRRVVFQRVLSLMLELAHEGREGKPIGTLMVVGDYREVQKYCKQNIINPFKGYPEKERNILDDQMRETVKEFAYIDGAFVLKGNGVIMSAGTTLVPAVAAESIPPGLGSRHAAAAAITGVTNSIVMTVSESTGTIRIWRRGRMITEIEKAPQQPVGWTTPSNGG